MRFLMLPMLAVLTMTEAHAQGWEETRAFANPSALANGAISSSRMPISGSALNIGTESNYLLPVTPAQAVKIIRDVSTNPTENDSPLARPTTANDFAALTVTNPALKTARGLNLSNTEQQQLADSDSANHAWRALLLNRATAFQNGGLIKTAPYDFANTTFQPASELVSLLKQRPPVLKRFMNIMDAIMTGKSGDGEPPVHYWANEKIQGRQNLALGVIHTGKTEHGCQVADFTYYSASNYYLSITLYEFWPVSGQSQTYVWRGDYVISPSISHTKGIERMAAENIMLLEVKAAIRAQITHCAAAR
ncbi:MAG: hypothetical protein LBD30_07710 [Verrucomicrobiales bacterium]|jgi:hypothetical protein|nr:hypothetical protein [Verrucomicrobiales bacterium]